MSFSEPHPCDLEIEPRIWCGVKARSGEGWGGVGLGCGCAVVFGRRTVACCGGFGAGVGCGVGVRGCRRG